MAHVESQADIVKEFMLRQEQGEIVTEPVVIPGLAEHFEVIPEGVEVTTHTIRVPGLSELAVKSRTEIAEALAGLLDYRQGVVGFEWVVGRKDLKVRFVEGFEQKTFDSAEERSHLIELMRLVLQLRREITGVEWTFGERFVEITYVA